MQSELKNLLNRKTKGQEEHFSAFILVIFGLILTILIVIILLHEKANTSAALAEYSMVSHVKEITYKFASCFSADYFGLIDSAKFDQADAILQTCFKGEEIIAVFEVKNLDTGEKWAFPYVPPEMSPPTETSYRPSSYKLFLPIKEGNEISNGVVNVRIELYV